MSEEIREAVQIIEVAYDGIEIAMKVGSGGISAMQKAIDFLKGMLDYEKSLGKTSMRKLLMKGGDLQVLEFATADMKKVEKYAKKYGILYSVLPDADRKNGKTEIIFHTEAVPRANMLLQKLSGGRIATFDDYLKNGDEKQLNKLMEFLKNQKKGNEMSPSPESARANMLMDGLIEKVGMYAMEKKTINVDAVKENFSINHEQAENVIKQLETIGFLDKGDESGNHKVMMDKEAFLNRIRGYQDLADRMRAVAASKHMNLSDVTISKTLIQTENERAVKTRIPGTWGEKARYVWIKKENIMEIHSGKTMLTFIDREKDYKIYDKDNRVVETMKGEALYSNHYDKSDCYNPFSYIREETDIVKLITNLIANTTPKGSTPSDPFWEKAEGLFLQAIFYYVWLEEKPSRRNFETVLQLLGEAEVTQQGKPSHLDVRMKFLEENNPLGPNHPAVKQYNKCMRGAGDTVRSIIISANSRLAFLENKQVLRLLSKDELNLADIGIGVNGDGETKTALFCVIPDSDKSYNFIIGMLYTQIFQELYYQADFNCGGRLPIHVTFMLDEFANVALPDDYCSLLSTMRSREISSIIIIQNFAQLKALFKDTWETVPGNCDTFIYLGGNEQSTHKYVSELLGKGTIDKKSSGETKGRQGSSSRNYDVLGRELFTPDEVRKLDNKKCIIFIRGFDPIMDNKYIPFAHPMFKQTADGGGKPYVHHMSSNNEVVGPPYEILSQKALEHYKQLKEKGENVYIDKLTYEEFMMIGDKELGWRFQMLDEQEQKDRFNAEQGQELEYSEESEITDKRKELPKIDGKDTILRRMAQWEFTKEQQEEAQKAMIVGVPENKILEYFYPDVEVEEMRQVRENFEKASA